MSAPDSKLVEIRTALDARCNTIEEAYEFMLAYAGQGLASDTGSAKGTQVRDYLSKASAALGEIAQLASGYSAADGDPLAAFLRVVDNDAQKARAAVNLVLAQPAISSQVVDNLNASTHLRAVLTDLFLVDEVLKGVRA